MRHLLSQDQHENESLDGQFGRYFTFPTVRPAVELHFVRVRYVHSALNT